MNPLILAINSKFNTAWLQPWNNFINLISLRAFNAPALTGQWAVTVRKYWENLLHKKSNRIKSKPSQAKPRQEISAFWD
jgi:hypothetical protein